MKEVEYTFFSSDTKKVMQELGKERLLAALEKMVLIRNFEIRAESAYQHGKVGGFFHAYMGQEAIQTGAVDAMGIEPNWWTTTYRCHALALLMGSTPNELMAELYGKVTGNALGRGGSMHMYGDRMLGGFGIVGGHLPIATGAGFTLKYEEQDGVSICFLGDGAVAQGAVHESLNLASLWDLPCIFVIENNKWGMGTAVNRAIAAQPIADHMAHSYEMESYTLDGMDYYNCYAGFAHIAKQVKESHRPVIVEAITERFRGHSISDPALYRSKDELKQVQERDPIKLFSESLIGEKWLTQEEFEAMDKAQKEIVIASMKYAEESPDPDPATLEEDVFAPPY